MDCWSESEKVQARLGYIPGEISFFDDMSGTEFLKFITDYRKIGTQNRKKELLERFELDPKGKIKKMSKGMKQKLGIVAAFMHDPDILILDEPTSGLDPLMQNRFVSLVAEEKERGKTILMSSHIFEEVERTCDRIGIIQKGRMIAVDSAAALHERHTRSYIVTLDNEDAAKAFAADFDGICNGKKVTVTTKQSLEETLSIAFLHFPSAFPSRGISHFCTKKPPPPESLKISKNSDFECAIRGSNPGHPD